jgi:hypothetical protein
MMSVLQAWRRWIKRHLQGQPEITVHVHVGSQADPEVTGKQLVRALNEYQRRARKLR